MGSNLLIDYKKLKERVSIENVCEEWGIELGKSKGSQLVGECPLCARSGFKVTPSFNSWKCFSCGEHGNILNLVAALEECALRDASVMIAERFNLVDQCAIVKSAKINRHKRSKNEVEDTPVLKQLESEGVGREEQGSVVFRNDPLRWALKSLDPEHFVVIAAGIAPDVLRELNAGYCTSGSMKDRLALPFYDGENRLVGYCGVDLEDKKEASIIFPPTEKFNRSLALFGTSIASRELRSNEVWRSMLYITRNPLDTLHLYSMGLRAVISPVCRDANDKLSVHQLKTIDELLNGSHSVGFIYNNAEEISPPDIVSLCMLRSVRVYVHSEEKPIRKWSQSDVNMTLLL